ncbi:hypothetical protein PUN28_011998 [Cardiocondyla obscurior]|uniref:Uncharacterized protein n=1 Tax=Cardiocondyla obscurior TaxID=286306 RepID=A0AAW2FBJ1_9HYME
MPLVCMVLIVKYLIHQKYWIRNSSIYDIQSVYDKTIKVSSSSNRNICIQQAKLNILIQPFQIAQFCCKNSFMYFCARDVSDDRVYWEDVFHNN